MKEAVMRQLNHEETLAISEDLERDGILHPIMAGLLRGFPMMPADVDKALGGVAQAAVALLDGIDYAGTSRIADDKLESVGATATVVSAIDGLQREYRQGPSFDAAVADAPVKSPDLRSESRWPLFSSAALHLGVGGVMSFQLGTPTVGGAYSLNLLSSGPQQLSSEQEALAMMLATYAAAALNAANAAEQFHSSLASRDIIGQAKGYGKP